MPLHKGNYYKWRQSRQRYAVKAVLGRIAHIREVLLLYGGFAWLPRQRKQIRQVTWQRRTCMLGSGGWNQATKNMEAGTWRLGSWNQAIQNMEAGTWRLGSWNQATKNMEAGTWMPVPESRNLEPGSGYLPNNSSQTIPSNQIGQATEAPFPGEAWFMYLL